MPILLHVDELKPGMRLLHAVQRDEQTMLAAGKVLEEWEINALRRRCPGITVQIGDPVLDGLVEFQDDSHDREVATTVNRQIGRLMGSVRDKLGSKTALEGGDIAGLQAAVNSVIQYITDHPVTAALLVHFGESGSYLQEHAGNVFYISLLVGNSIRDYICRERQRNTRAELVSPRYAMNLTPLALGSLFHDLGMIPLEHLYEQGEPLTEKERQQVRAHPEVGAALLPEGFDAVAKAVVRTHHENSDGSGYPNGIPGSKLHVFSRILRACDALDAATSDRVYRRAKTPARVLWEMLAGPTSKHYDPAIVKILASLVQPFPIGAKVRLGCGRFGVVVRHNRRFPFRPVLVVAFDEHGRKLKRDQLDSPVDLSRRDDVRLVEFGGDDLSFLNRSEADETWGDAEVGSEDVEILAEEKDFSLFDMVYP